MKMRYQNIETAETATAQDSPKERLSKAGNGMQSYLSFLSKYVMHR